MLSPPLGFDFEVAGFNKMSYQKWTYDVEFDKLGLLSIYLNTYLIFAEKG